MKINTPNYKYTFTFLDKADKSFDVHLDPDNYSMIPEDHTPPPSWTALDHHACENCPLLQSDTQYCPVSANMSPIVTAFSRDKSYDAVDVTVDTPNRSYCKTGLSIQEALSPLLGLIMVTSGCPDLDWLRPMVMQHLPFANFEETAYRATTTYLLAQYMRKKRGLEPDWQMDGLVKIYSRINEVNSGLCKRLRAATPEDANLNAIIILDSFAQILPQSIDQNMERFETLFSKYLQ